ncbi:MAG: tetratricopeptide repeat protein [Pseudomonadota bacterium]
MPLRQLWLGLVPVVLAFIAAAPSVSYEFAADDGLLILENRDVQSLRNVPSLFHKDFFERSIVGLPTRGEIGYYRPLTKVSFAIDWFVWGRNPFGFHLTNVLLHGVAAFLVFWLALALPLSMEGALIGSILFALYPSHPQAVALINARSDLLCAIGALFACFGTVRRSWPVVVMGTLLAAGSKETGLIVPGLVGLLLFVREGPVRTNLRLLYSSCVSVAAYLVVRHLVLGPAFPKPPASSSGTSGSWFLLSGKSLGAHLYALAGLDTSGLSLILLPRNWTDPFVWVSWLVVLIFIAVWFRCAVRREVPGFVLFWVIGGFLPLLAVRNIHVPYSGVIIALHERWTYLPSIGISLTIGWLLGRQPISRRIQWLGIATALILVGVYWTRMSSYASDRSMERAELEVLQQAPFETLPGPFQAKRLGMEGVQAALGNHFDVAAERLSEALTLEPDNPYYQQNLGTVLMQQGDLPRAIILLRKSLAPKKIGTAGGIDTFTVDDGQSRGRPERYALLGEALRRAGDLSASTAALEMAHEGDPANAKYALNLAVVLAVQRRWEEAKRYYRTALSLKPCYPLALIALQEIGRIQKNETLTSFTRETMKACGP